MRSILEVSSEQLQQITEKRDLINIYTYCIV